MSDPDIFQRRLERERAARKEAERLLEAKSRELFSVNLKLQEHATHLEAEIAERQRAEVHFRNITEGLAEGLLLIQSDGAILYANQRMASLTGYRPEELLTRRIHDLLTDQEPPAEVRFWELVDTGPVCITVDLELRHQDGRTRVAQIHAAPYQDSAGRCRGMVAAFIDMTDRRRAEAELKRLNARLVEASRVAGMAEVATGVLHNVGNVLNSINVSSTLIRERLRQSRLTHLTRAVGLMKENEATLDRFLTEDPKGKQLPRFLELICTHLQEENQRLLEETDGLDASIQHIKHIVSTQQSFARVAGAEERVAARELLEQAVEMNASSFHRDGIDLIRDYQAHPELLVDRHKVIQILVNLLRNARHAVLEARPHHPTVSLSLADAGHARLRITVADNGVGIPAENLTRIFSHGFTTKRNGHGFGLHSGALAAQEMGGCLTVASDGPGQGAVFTLELPTARDSNPSPPEAAVP